MILSHGHRFIVFKTRKTGGTSFEIALSKYMAAADIVTPIAPDDEKIRASMGYTGPQNHGPAGGGGPARSRYYNHMGAEEVRTLVAPEVFDGYIKAAIVRNPFDYAVSWYFWERSRVSQTSRDDFRLWLKDQYRRRPAIEADYRLHRRPNPGVFASNRMITHIAGRSAMDLLLRYEDFRADVAAFAACVGLPDALAAEFSAIKAKGNYRPAAATAAHMFEGFDEGQEIIAEAFAEEIAQFGYRLG